MPFIETNGIKMYYEEQGEGEPLILHATNQWLSLPTYPRKEMLH